MEAGRGDFAAGKSLGRTSLRVWAVSQDKLMQSHRGRSSYGQRGAKKKMPEVKPNEKGDDEN